jgi:hypothetical protein
VEKGGKMNNLFLLNQFKNKFNEKVEEKYRINEIENEENIYEFSYGSYNFKINREREVFINSERIFFNDIAIKKNIFQKSIYLKNQKLKLSKQEVNYLEIIFRNIFSLSMDIEVSEFFHSLSSRESNFKKDYLLFLRDNLFKYSLDYIFIYKYIFDLGLSLNLEKNVVDSFILKELYKEKIFRNDMEYRYFLNDFIYFFLLFDFESPNKKILNDLAEGNKELSEYLSKKLYKKEIKALKSINKYVEVRDQKNYFFSRQIYLNILKRNELNNIGGAMMYLNEKEEREFIIEFKDMNDEICQYSINSEKDEVSGLFNVEYLESLEKESNPILISGTDRIDFNSCLQYKREDTDKDEKDRINRAYPTIGKTLQNVNFVREDFINFPKIFMSDITEQKILGFREINREFLRDKGVWLNQGKRYIEVTLENILNYFQEQKTYEIDFKLFLNRIGNRKIDKEKIDTNWINNIREEDFRDVCNNFIFKFDLDTDYIFEKVKDELKDSFINLGFEIEISFKSNIKCFKIMTPFEIKFKNAEKYVGTDAVVIDFGTSSTCIAYSNGKMITLENMDGTDNKSRIFENPTNFLVNNWENFSEKWLNETYPDIIRMKEIYDRKGDFFQGHKLKDEEGGLNRDIINATLDQIKLVPYRRLKLGETVQFRPAIDHDKDINLVSGEATKEDKDNFKPIVAYSYLLGRNVMYPIKRTNEINDERLSVNFRMTIPTKFDKEVKEAIREDIERGLKLSAPQNIRDMIKVEIGNEEPVAFIGAMIEKGDIKRGDKFAVLDLGGGTLDYAFGLYRKATEEEEEEDEEVVNVLEVFNTDGNERGGAEYLINKISYSIYEINREDMKNKNIPFIVPYDEKPIEYFPENLLIGKTTNSYLNLKYINEISKNILIDLESMKNELYPLTLKDINNVDTVVELQVNSKEISSELIEKYMEKIVDDFIDLIQKNIPTPYDNLKIFRAGNGSRSEILKSILDKKIYQFWEKTSILPDELNQDGVNSKTAVVLGEVNLSGITNIKVIYKNKSKEDEVPFEFYVGRQDEEGSSAFEELIYKGSIERTWKKYGVVPKLKREKEIFYSDVLGISDIKDERLRRQRLSFSEEEMQNSGRLWIRPNVANKIEYVFSKEEPNEEITGAIIELKR